jgi:hypothetical protein
MMNDRQLGFMYVFIGLLAVLIFAGLEAVISNPASAEEYADQLCKELYGPQVGATWEKGTLMCESARGEIIEVRRIK